MGIAAAAVSKGHRIAKSQFGVKIIAKIKMAGKAIEAIIEASEIYRHTKATIAHIAKLGNEQIV